ncbi:MAG: hypothetical protein AAFY46_16645 [Planctomycetota bacterium]
MAVTRMLASVLMAFVLALSAPSRASEPVPTRAIFVIVENGITVTGKTAETNLQITKSVLGQIRGMKIRDGAETTTLHVILTSDPGRILWSGTPRDLKRQAAALVQRIEFVPTCSDLARTYELVDVTRRIERPDETLIFAIGPGLNLGYPCGEGDLEITLPQPMPRGFKLPEIALEASKVALLNLHHSQLPVMLGLFSRTGVMERAQTDALSLHILDEARTRAAINTILE